MTYEYDEKGKLFTNVVNKRSVAATLQTTTHMIRGFIHIRQDERVKDELDRDELFLAVTDAVVFDGDGEPLHRAAFLAVRRAQIVWLYPQEEGGDE
jgi:hypothetical protein